MLKYILLFVFLVACFQIQAQEENLIDEDSTGVCFDSDPQDDYGDLQDGSDDAFDGYGELWIDDDRFVISAGTADYMPPNATFGPETYSGLTVTRKVYAYVGPNCETITRYIECFTNSTAAPITFEVKIEGDLGSDSDTQLEGTSSGDLLATKEDIWFSSSEEGLDWNNGSNDPPLAFNLYGPGAIIGLDSVFFEFGDDDLEFFYDSLTVQPGETCCIMHFITQAQTRADALAIAAALSTPDAAALAGADISNIKNFGFAVEFSAVATCIDAVNAADAGEGMVYVEVEVPNQAISGIDITVSSGGASATIPGGVGTVIIGPIPYTGGLLEVQAALSINLNNPSKLNIKGPVCGLTPDDTGDLHGPGLFCSDQGNVTAPAVLVQSVPQRVSTTAPPTTGYHYVVVDNTGGMNNLIAFNQSGLFGNLPLLTSYTVYRFHVGTSDSPAFVAALAALGNGSLDPAINKTGSFGAFCYTLAPYVLANPQPIPAALEACEDAAGSMSGTFDLTDADATVDPGGLGTVTYHMTQAEAQMNMNPIANPGAYVSGNGIVWARVDDGVGCPKVSEVTLTVLPLPIVNSITINSCEAITGCNYTIVDLTSYDAQIAAGCNVDWYIGGFGTAFPVANPTAFQYGTTAMTVVVTCPGSICSTRTTIQLNVLSRPAPPATADLIYCVGAAASPLTAIGMPGATLTWYTSAADALAQQNGTTTAPTPNTASDGYTSSWVTQTNAAGCESRPAELEITVVGISNVSTTYRCVGVGPATTYQLCFKFDRTTVGPTGAFTVQVGAVVFGPYTYSGYDLNVSNNAGNCFALLDPSFVPDGQTVTLTVRDVDANCGSSTTFTEDPCANLGIAPIMMLGGNFDPTNGLMRDNLRQQGLIPLTEPYTALGFTHFGGGGGEQVDPVVLQVTGNDAIVDWVFIELRDPANLQTVVATRSALLQRDGDIVDIDGVSSLRFYALTGSYNISVRHRNHLGVMTLHSVPLTALGTSVNFGTVPTYGTNATTTVGTTVGSTNTLVGGNVINDGMLKYSGPGNDRAPILSIIGGLDPTAIMTGYLQEDVNMDGIIKYSGPNNDRAVILNNIGGTDPTVIRFEQVP